MLSGSGDRSRPTWGELQAGYQFRPREKGQATVGQLLFQDLFKDNIR
jgi:hypothetical protein